MSSYDELIARIDSVRQLGAVIGALRGIAAAHAQRSRSYLAGVLAYTDTIIGAMTQALSLDPGAIEARPQELSQASAAELLILFCAEQGFAGAFTPRIFDAAGEAALHSRLILVGRRGLLIAGARGMEADWCTPMIARVDGAAALADRIADRVLQGLASGTWARAQIIYTRLHDGSRLDIEKLSLLPLDLGRFGRPLSRPPPLIQLDPAELLQSLAVEYLRAQLTGAVLHSFAAENTARMLAMSAARENVGRMLNDLRGQARTARQDEITSEVIELAASAGQL